MNPPNIIFCVYHDMKNCGKSLLWRNSSTYAQKGIYRNVKLHIAYNDKNGNSLNTHKNNGCAHTTGQVKMIVYKNIPVSYKSQKYCSILFI